MKRGLGFVVVVMLSVVAAASQAQTTDARAVAAELKKGGYVIVMRHGATNRDQADTDPLNPDNVAKQRLLSEDGREQARQVGEAFKKLGIPVGIVYTSMFNRAVETGKLIGGHAVVTTFDVTEGGLVVTPIENDRRTKALKKMIATGAPSGKNTLIVTHKPNILDALGKDWFEVKEGEASVFRVDGATKPELIARIQAVDWIKAASE
jgi:broad specificity phosphatase PhoE